jgi:hypothetical protein
LLRIQTISRGAGYVDTLFYLLKALRLDPVAPVDGNDDGNSEAAKSNHVVKKSQKRKAIESRAKLLKSIHETFLATAEGHLLAAEYQVFQKTWTLPFVTGRLQLAEWMAGSPLTVHSTCTYTCTCYPYDA